MKPLEELLEIAKSAKERADKATEGPWFVDGLGTDKAELKNNADLRIYVFNPRGFKSLQSTDLTAFFIASARTDVPRLSDAVIDLITQLKYAQAELTDKNAALNTAENDYWFMASLLERTTNDKYLRDAVNDCVERMKFRKPMFKVLQKYRGEG